MNTQIKQFIASIAFSLPAAIIFANAAHSQTITPVTQPDCSAISCTVDGTVLPETVVTITPKATITQVCRPDGCSSSWVGHEMDESAIGNEPEVFVIPKSDQK